MDENKHKNTSQTAFLLRLVLVLCVICVAVAVLLAAINVVTKDKIEENILKAKTDAVSNIFENCTKSELYCTFDDGTEVYLVYGDGGIIGYSVITQSTGFGGEIELMVGINSELRTVGVKIISMSETPGVGSKTNTADFLDRFIGNGKDNPVDGVDSISGATISSVAVKDGIKKAFGIDFSLDEAAAERGVSIITPNTPAPPAAGNEAGSEVVTPSDNTPTESDPSESTYVTETNNGTTVPESTEAETSDIPFFEYGGESNSKYPVESSVGSDRYEIEIPKDDVTATTEKTEPPEPETTETEATEPTVSVPETTEPELTAPSQVETTDEPETTSTPLPEPEESKSETTTDPNEIPPWLVGPTESTESNAVSDEPAEDTTEDMPPVWIGG